MDEPIPTYVADHDLAALLKAAAARDEPVRVKAETSTFVVRIVQESVDDDDLLASYDPEAVSAALDAYSGSWRDLNVDAIKETIYQARETGSRSPGDQR
jgi:hypothetical protein